MDPVTIVSLVGACSTIALRAGTLAKELTSLARRLEQANRSITQLSQRLYLFKETMDQLKTYTQQAEGASKRTKKTLRLFLKSCEDALSDIEKHSQSISQSSGSARSRLNFIGRARVVWNETDMAKCEEKLGYQLQMINTYIQLIELNNENAQEDAIDSAAFTNSLRDATEGSVSAEDWDDATTLSAFQESETKLPRRSLPEKPVASHIRKTSSLSTTLKTIMMSSKQRSAYASYLCEACENRNPRQIEEYIKENYEVNYLSSEGKLPLNCAVSAGLYTIIKMLLESKADPNKRDKDGHLPLANAVKKGNESVAKLLIQFGANVQSYSAGCSIVELAVKEKNVAMLRLLVQNGVDTAPHGVRSINLNYDSPSTLLIVAIEKDNMEIVRLLLENGADCQIHTCAGSGIAGRDIRPLNLALWKKDFKLTRTLLEYGADPEDWCRQAQLSSAFLILVEGEGSGIDLAMLMLENGAQVTLSKSEIEAVFRAIDGNSIKRLLQAGVGVDIGETELIEMVKENPKLARLILNANPELKLRTNAVWEHGTLLIDAIVSNNLELVGLLLDNGAQPGGPQLDGWTPLCAAIFSHKASDIIRLLLSRGADQNEYCSGVGFKHPMSIWTDSKSISSDLLISGSHVSKREAEGGHIDYHNIIGYQADCVSPLHIAVALDCCVDYVELLIQHGAHVNVFYSYTQSDHALQAQLNSWTGHTVSWRNISVLHAARNKAVDIVLRSGANVNAKDGLGHTPLSWAILDGTQWRAGSKIEALLKAKASLSNIAPKNTDALALWYGELKHRRGDSCEPGRIKPHNENLSILSSLLGAGADPLALLATDDTILGQISQDTFHHDDDELFAKFLMFSLRMMEKGTSFEIPGGFYQI